MTRHDEKRLALPVHLNRAGTRTAPRLEIVFEDAAIPAWVAALVLLKERLTERVVITDSEGAEGLSLSVAGVAEMDERARVVSQRGLPSFRVSPTELDYWLHFFLNYFRDGYGDVNHIDIEAKGGEGSPPLDLTLMVRRVGTPISIAEARRQLGL